MAMNDIPAYGIVTDNQLLYVSRDTRQKVIVPLDITTFTHVGQLVQLAIQHKLLTLWVHLSVEGYNQLPDSFLIDALSQGYHVFPTDFERTPFCTARCNVGYSQEIGIGFTNHELSRWCVHSEVGHTPTEAYLAFSYLERLLDVPMQFSPANVAQRLIRDTNTGKRSEYLTRCTSDLTLFRQVKGTMGSTGLWSRPLRPCEKQRKHLIHIDRNASYLNSCGIQLGYGDYDHRLHINFDKKIPGLWYITVTGTSEYDGVTLPAITPLLHTSTCTGWEYTTTVQMLIDAGYHVNVHEACVWPLYRANILDPFRKLVSNAYVSLREDTTSYKNSVACAIAKEALKGVYVAGLSNLSHETPYKDSNYVDAPHWYHAIIDDASQRTLRNIETHRLATSETPVMRLNDGLWYVCDEDVVTSLHTFRIGVKVGYYKSVYTLPLTSEVIDILESNIAESYKSAALKKIIKDVI